MIAVFYGLVTAAAETTGSCSVAVCLFLWFEERHCSDEETGSDFALR